MKFIKRITNLVIGFIDFIPLAKRVRLFFYRVYFFQDSPKKSLLELWTFWTCFILITSMSIFLATMVFYARDLHSDFSPKGYKKFLELFRFPLSAFAINIPVLALISAIHRSAQTKAQITATENQNLFANHYKHAEEFRKYIKESLDSKKFPIKNPLLAHAELFPNTKIGDYRACIHGKSGNLNLNPTCKYILASLRTMQSGISTTAITAELESIDTWIETINSTISANLCLTVPTKSWINLVSLS